MFSQVINGLENWIHKDEWDLHSCEPSCTITEKTVRVGTSRIFKANKRASSTHTSHSISPLRLLFWTTLFIGARGQLTDPFPAQFELSSLDGTNGFIVNGEVAGDQSGISVSSAGDVNGDRLSDLVIGAWQASPSGRVFAGKSYVIFGSKTPVSGGMLDLSSLNGTNGFIMNGEVAGDRSGISVSSVGDMNGDGLFDLVIGARYADPSGKSQAGKSYVIFGTKTPISGGNLDLSSLDGTNGFIVNGEAADDNSGISVSSAGDVNGDGLDDLVIGAFRASPNGKIEAGKSYVIFGTGIPISGGIIDLSSLNGKNGYILNGEATNDWSGGSVSSAGDMNGDGFSDLVIGAYNADPSGKRKAGKSYVIFGTRTSISGGMLDLSSLNGTNGFIVNGEAALEKSSISVSSAGDINGDGLDDLVIGACRDSPLGNHKDVNSYVIFGTRTPISGGIFDLSNLNGTNGFIVNGEIADNLCGISVSSAGDVNQDELSDFVIGNWPVSPSGKERAGKSYVIFGARTPFSGGTLDLSSLDGRNGIIVNGEAAGDWSGKSISTAGDVNGDGFADIVIGASFASPSGKANSGKSYVIFGRKQKISSPFLIEGIAVAVSAIACSVFGGVVFYLKKRSHTNTPDPGTSLQAAHPDSEVLAEYAEISNITAEMQSAHSE